MPKPIKTTAAEWLAYVRTPWKPDEYIDDEAVYFGDAEEPDTENDMDEGYLSSLDPTMPVRIECGVILHNHKSDHCIDLLSHFLAWRKERDRVMISIDVPRARSAELASFLESIGIRTPKTLQDAADAVLVANGAEPAASTKAALRRRTR